MQRLPIPKEDEEQIALVQWLQINGYTFHHSPNETWTTSRTQKTRNKRMGVSAGFPDLIIVLKRGALLFIELKRQKGPRGGVKNKPTEEQIAWLKKLERIENVGTYVAYGYKDAISFILKMEEL